MKRTVIPIALKSAQELEACEFDLELQAPGLIVQTVVQVKPRQIQSFTGKGPEYDFIPTLLVLIDPDAEKQTRHFIMVPPMKVVDTAEFEYVTSLLSPDGRVFFIFEETKKDGEVPQTQLVLP